MEKIRKPTSPMKEEVAIKNSYTSSDLTQEIEKGTDRYGRPTYYCHMVAVIISFWIIPYSTIIPYVADGEYYYHYYYRNYGRIHRRALCESSSPPWFTRKYVLFDFIRERDSEFCEECFSDSDIKKLHILHKINLKKKINYLRGDGASEEYINNFREKYSD